MDIRYKLSGNVNSYGNPSLRILCKCFLTNHILSQQIYNDFNTVSVRVKSEVCYYLITAEGTPYIQFSCLF